MREIKITVPKELAADVAKLALAAGAASASYHDVYIYGLNQHRGEMRIKTSTPIARTFIDLLLATPFYNRDTVQVSSHDIKSLMIPGEMHDITKPVVVPLTDIFEDLWQNSHITPTFIAKVFGGSLLLSYAMFNNNIVLMIGALLFTPFTPLLMGVAFGLRSGDKQLLKHSALAFVTGTILTIAGAYSISIFYHQPFRFEDFGSVPCNLLISAVAGVIAALTDADDVGRRQLIALAATFPYVKFPVWLGVCLGRGFPETHTVLNRCFSFGGNMVVIVATTWIVYVCIGVRRGHRVLSQVNRQADHKN